MDIDERRAWGPLIREARKHAGLDQETLAAMAGTTRRTIGSIERGDTVAQRAVLQRVLAALNLTDDLDVEADVAGFIALIRPLLQRLTPDERAELMPRTVELIADALRRGGQSTRPAPLAMDEPAAARAMTRLDYHLRRTRPVDRRREMQQLDDIAARDEQGGA